MRGSTDKYPTGKTAEFPGIQTAEDLEAVYEEYQRLMDEFQAMDGDNYESNIRKQLKMVGMSQHENTSLSQLSGGE